MSYVVTNISAAKVAIDDEVLLPHGFNTLPVPRLTPVLIKLKVDGYISYTGSDDLIMTSSGCTATATFTPTAGVYPAAGIIDIAQEFAFKLANGQDVPPGSLISITDTVMTMAASAPDAGDGAYVLHAYEATPPSAQADTAVWTLSGPDAAYYIDQIPLGTLVDLGGALRIKQSALATNIKLTNSSAWGRLVTTPGLTMTDVPRTVILYGILR